MTDITTTTIDTYLSAWTEPDAERRRELIERAWEPAGRLVDPPITGEGHEGIAQAFAALQQAYPGHTFRRASAIDEHHGQFRFAWELVSPGGDVAMAGIDVGALGDDGRLSRITGFIGDLPPAENAIAPKAGLDAI